MTDRHEDDDEARQLLAPLAGEPPATSTVDVRRAMAVGRRRRWTRRVAGAGAAAATTALVVAGVPVALDAVGGVDQSSATHPADSPTATAATATAPAPLTGCEFEWLPRPDEAFQSLVTAGDPTGRYLAGRVYLPAGRGESNLVSGTRVESVIWDHAEPAMVDIPGYDAVITDINADGVAVAASFPDADGSRPQTGWVYRDGELSALPGDRVGAVSGQLRIDDRGVIVGARPAPGSDGGGRAELVPMVWRSPDAHPEELSRPGAGWSVTATDSDSDGTVVGFGRDPADSADSPGHTFVWAPDGSRQQLPWPEVTDGEVVGFTAESIEDQLVSGEVHVSVEGPSSDPDGPDLVQRRWFRYDLRTGQFTELAAGEFPLAWNHAGWWVAAGEEGLSVVSPSGDRVPLPRPETELDGPEDSPMTHVVSVSAGAEVIGGQLSTDRDLSADGDPPWYADGAVAWRCA